MPHLFTDELRNPVWVDNLCVALIELAETEYRGVLHLVEIKDGRKRPSARRTTPAEDTTIARFRRVGCPVLVVTNEDELLKAIGALS